MKILMIMTSKFHQSGITMVVSNYCKEMTEMYNCKIDFVVPNDVDEKFKKDIGLNKSNFFKCSKKLRIYNTIVYIYKLVKIIKKERYDIVHVHGSSSLLYIELLAAKIAGVKTRVVHSHNVKTDHKFLHYILKNSFLKSYTKALACSKEAGTWLFGENEFIVVNNGFDINKFQYNEGFRKKIRAKLEIDDDIFLLGHIGLFNNQKNQNFLIDIMEKVVKKDNKIKLLLVGNGNMKAQIQDRIKEKKLCDNVIFYGITNKPEEIYSALDMFLMPSKYEGLGLVALEAQISGLPCILSDNVPKIVSINSNVVMLEINNESIEKWCNYITKKMKKNRNINLNLFNDYDIKTCAKKLYEIYQKNV